MNIDVVTQCNSTLHISQGIIHSTFVSAILVLRKIDKYLSNHGIFEFSAILSLTKQVFFELLWGHTFKKRCCYKPDSERQLLLYQLQFSFSALGKYLVWTTFLDPRFGKNSPHWELDGENYASVAILIDEEVIMVDDDVCQPNSPLVVPVVEYPPTYD